MDKPIVGRIDSPSLLLTGMALAAGVTIAWVDTRPTWDDTGITAGGILVAAALGGAFGMRPWLAALLVVAPLVMAELRTSGIGLLIPSAIAFVGAYGGAFARQTLKASSK